MGFGRKLLVGTIVVVGGLYTVGWFGAQQLAYSQMDEAATRLNQGRNGANCRDRAVSGFPLSFDVNCKQTVVALAPGIKAEVAGVSTSAQLLKLGRVEAEFTSPARLEGPRQAIIGDARFAKASNFADLWIDGARRMGGAVENLQLTLTGPRAGPIQQVSISRGTSDVASSGTPNSLDVTADVKGLDLVRASGPSVPRLDLFLRATLLDIGAVVSDDDQFEKWLDAGGRVKIAEATLSAQQSSVSISGDIAVAPSGLISGKVRLHLVGINGMPALAEAMAPGSRKDAEQIVGVLGAMTKLVQTQRGPAQEIDLTISNGAVLVGFIPLPKTIPPLF